MLCSFGNNEAASQSLSPVAIEEIHMEFNGQPLNGELSEDQEFDAFKMDETEE